MPLLNINDVVLIEEELKTSSGKTITHREERVIDGIETIRGNGTWYQYVYNVRLKKPLETGNINNKYDYCVEDFIERHIAKWNPEIMLEPVRQRIAFREAQGNVILDEDFLKDGSKKTAEDYVKELIND
jgi:cellulose biosynthesis protein BcsQ